MSVLYQSERFPTTHRHQTEPTRRTAGTRRIGTDYVNSVRVLRAAVKANRAAGQGHITGERVDDVSCEIIDLVPLLDQAARRTLRLVAGQLKRACADPRPRRRPVNSTGPAPNGPFAQSARYGNGRNGQ
jgi:hypothetical protein